MKLQNDVQQTIVKLVREIPYTTPQDIIDDFEKSLMYSISSKVMINCILEKIELEIQKLIEWSIIYEVEEEGELVGYYQTDWTDEQINSSIMFKQSEK